MFQETSWECFNIRHGIGEFQHSKIAVIILNCQCKRGCVIFGVNLKYLEHIPDSKVHGANMGSTWILWAPDGPHDGPINLVIRETSSVLRVSITTAIRIMIVVDIFEKYQATERRSYVKIHGICVKKLLTVYWSLVNQKQCNKFLFLI